MLAAKTIATKDMISLAAKIQPLPLPTCDSHFALFKLCLYKDSIEKNLRNLSNRPTKDAVTPNRVTEEASQKKREISPCEHGEIFRPADRSRLC